MPAVQMIFSVIDLDSPSPKRTRCSQGVETNCRGLGKDCKYLSRAMSHAVPASVTWHAVSRT
eukprot:13985089-Alexandrium_andersonii.AAC.1